MRNENNRYAEGTAVSYRLTADGQIILSGREKVNAYGELLLKGLPLKEVAGKKLLLLSDFKQKNEQVSIRTGLGVTYHFVRLKFFPEGGELVNGVESYVAFEARDLNGQPVPLSAKLVEDGKELLRLSSDRTGMGNFNFRPVPGRNYTILLDDAKLVALDPALPAARADGLVIHVDKGVVDDSLRFEIRGAVKTGGFVLVHDYRQNFFLSSLDLSAGKQSFAIPATELPDGFATITVLDAEARPLAERTLFKRPLQTARLSIVIDSSLYHQRSKVTVRIKATDANGVPQKARFSLGCVLNKRVDTAHYQSISSYYYFNNYLAAGALRGNAAYNPPAADRDMERFLLVQGWTRYRWKNLQQPDGDSLGLFNFRQEGQVYHYGSKPKKPVRLIVMASDTFSTVTTDAAGHFVLTEAQMTSRADWRINLSVDEPDQDTYTISLQNDNDQLQAKLARNAYPSPETLVAAEEEMLSPSAKVMSAVTVKARINTLDEFRSRRKQSQEECPDYVCMYNILNCPNHPTSDTKPQVGQSYYVNEAGVLVQKIYDGCTIAIMPRALTARKKENVITQLEGRYYTKEFYAADYSQYSPAFPETLTTLYWNPTLLTDEKGEVTFSFYTNDLEGTLAIIAEGITETGVVSGKKLFRVVK